MACGHQFSDNRIFTVLPLLPRKSLAPLPRAYPRACLVFPASLSHSRMQFLRLSLGFCSVMCDLRRSGKSCYPFENHKGSCVRGRRVKRGTSSLEANFAHRLDIMTSFGDFSCYKPSISTRELSQTRFQEFFLRTSRREP